MQFFICQTTLCYSKCQNSFFHQNVFISNHLPRPRLINFTFTFPWSSWTFLSHIIFSARVISLKSLNFPFTCRSQTFPCSSHPSSSYVENIVVRRPQEHNNVSLVMEHLEVVPVPVPLHHLLPPLPNCIPTNFEFEPTYCWIDRITGCPIWSSNKNWIKRWKSMLSDYYPARKS